MSLIGLILLGTLIGQIATNNNDISEIKKEKSKIEKIKTEKKGGR